MGFALYALIGLAMYLVLVAVHETGHYLAGWAAGIPRSKMQIRLLTFPQHVVIHDSGEWVGPSNIERYVSLMERHLRTTPRLYLYTAGGMLLETAFTLAVVVSLLFFGLPKIGLVVALVSLWLWISYVLLMDLPMTIRTRYPSGDLSGLWWLAKWPTILFGAAMLLVRIGLVWLSTR